MVAGFHKDKLCLLEFDIPQRRDLQINRLENRLADKHQWQAHPLIEEVQRQLDAYFTGRLKEFSIPIDIRGTSFQVAIWRLLLDIPYGDTMSYGELAIVAGDVKKVRAVGRANGENHMAILIPCHRVIGSDGALVGYGGELWRKKKLLTMERQFSGQPVQAIMDF